MLSQCARTGPRTGIAALAATALLATACGGGGGDDDSGSRVSGTVTVPEGQLADADTNDSQTAPDTNDDSDNPQALQNPATVGGFLTAQATGPNPADCLAPADRFETAADEVDYYRLNLTSSQQVRVRSFEPGDSPCGNTGATVTAELLNTGVDPVTVPPGATGELGSPGSGDYLLRLQAGSGSGTYQLSISSPVFTCSAGTAAVPGEFLVRLAADSGVTGALGSLTAAAPLAAELGMRPKARLSPRTQLWSVADAETAYHSLGPVSRAPAASAGSHAGARPERARALARTLEAHPAIGSAMPNYIYEPLTEPDDPRYRDMTQWNLDLIGLPQAWDQSQGESTDRNNPGPVVIAILDTGVYPGHEDLQGKRSGGGYDFAANPDHPNPEDTTGPIFHGSHVTGIAAAATDNGTGVAGAGWHAEFMPVRVLSDTGGTLADVIQGARYAAGLENSSGIVPDRPAQIINMSLGGKGGCIDDTAAAEFADIRAGPDGEVGTGDDVILIAAAGNAADTAPQFPASYPAVISVSATDRNDDLAPYSSTGPFVDVAAPGGAGNDGILSTVGPELASDLKDGYQYQQGTSMAAPHVAGVAALMKAVYPALNADRFETALKQERLTENIATEQPRNDRFGYGRIDAARAVGWAAEDPPPLDTMVEVQPEVILYEPDDNEAVREVTLTVRESSGDKLSTLGEIDVTDTQSGGGDWLGTAATGTPGEYTVTLDPSVVGDGTFEGTVTVSTGEGGPAAIPVILRKSVLDEPESASVQYILLVNTESGENQAQISGPAVDGAYAFQFDDVPDGSYFLISGSDIDNNGWICEAWEACGFYPETVRVTGNQITGLSFTTRFGSVSTGTRPQALTLPIQVSDPAR